MRLEPFVSSHIRNCGHLSDKAALHFNMHPHIHLVGNIVSGHIDYVWTALTQLKSDSTWKYNLHSLSSSCDYSGEEANTLSTIISFQVIVESDKVFLEPPLFHTTQSYFPQLLPIRLMLQTLCSFLVFLWTHPRRVVFVRRLDSLIEKVFRLCQQELLRSKCTFKPTWVFIRNSFCCSLT